MQIANCQLPCLYVTKETFQTVPSPPFSTGSLPSKLCILYIGCERMQHFLIKIRVSF